MAETIFAFQARAERNFRQRLAKRDAQIRRCATKLKRERQRCRDAVAELEHIREDYHGQASPKAYVAIIALQRVKRICKVR